MLSVASLTSFATAVLNEFGFFLPWSKLRVRIWCLTVLLVAGTGLTAFAYALIPEFREFADPWIL